MLYWWLIQLSQYSALRRIEQCDRSTVFGSVGRQKAKGQFVEVAGFNPQQPAATDVPALPVLDRPIPDTGHPGSAAKARDQLQ